MTSSPSTFSVCGAGACACSRAHSRARSQQNTACRTTREWRGAMGGSALCGHGPQCTAPGARPSTPRRSSTASLRPPAVRRRLQVAAAQSRCCSSRSQPPSDRCPDRGDRVHRQPTTRRLQHTQSQPNGLDGAGTITSPLALAKWAAALCDHRSQSTARCVQPVHSQCTASAQTREAGEQRAETTAPVETRRACISADQSTTR